MLGGEDVAASRWIKVLLRNSKLECQIQGDPEFLGLGFVDLDFGSSLG